MMTYVALLRGVNVGAHNRIKMDDLKDALSGIGLARIETYIQSGNIVFGSELGEEELGKAIRRAIADRFGCSVDLALRSATEMRALVDGLPFSPEEVARAEAENVEGESLYACLLSAPPEEGKRVLLSARAGEGERVSVRGRDVYLLLSRGIRNSKCAAAVQKLDPCATVRNWNTIQKLAGLSDGRE